MSLRWVRPIDGSRAVLLLGAFDPPTLAHVAIVKAASRALGLPGAFCLTQVVLGKTDARFVSGHLRERLLDSIASDEGFGLLVSGGGTYLEVARSLRSSSFAPTFVVGSDKLAQLADPSFYPDGEAGVAATFREVDLLVVPRPPAEVDRDRFAVLEPHDVFDDPSESMISATRAREAFADGRSLDRYVPPSVAQALEGYTAAEPR